MEENTNTPEVNTEVETSTNSVDVAGDRWTPESTSKLNYDETTLSEDDDIEVEKEKVEPEAKPTEKPNKEEKPQEQNLSQEELKTLQSEYNEMKMFFENIQKNPAILKDLYEKFVPQQQQQVQQPQTKLQEEPQKTWEDFSDEEFNDPKSFANGIRQRMMSEVQSQVKPVIEFANYMAQYLPHMQNAIQSFYIEQGNRAMSDLRSEYGNDIEPFLKEGTQECKAFAEKIKNNPQLTPKEAFLLVKPQFIKKEVDAKVANTLAQKRNQSLSSSSSRNGLAQPTKVTSIGDAIAKALKEHE